MKSLEVHVLLDKSPVLININCINCHELNELQSEINFASHIFSLMQESYVFTNTSTHLFAISPLLYHTFYLIQIKSEQIKVSF